VWSRAGESKKERSDLASRQPKLEEEYLAEWLDDVAHDVRQRKERIGEIASPSGCAYSSMEDDAIAKCLATFALYDSSSAVVTQRRCSATIRSEAKHDAATRLLLRRTDAEFRADPLDVIVYMLDLDSRNFQAESAANHDLVRFEVLEKVNTHHSVVFARYKARGISDRTFVNSIVAKQLADDPPSYAVAVMPIARHDKIDEKDEVGAVRAENRRSFLLTEVAPGVTKLQARDSLLA
jgi:hypothetical protein